MKISLKLIAIISIVSISLGLYVGYFIGKNNLNINNHTVFIWNDDEESIPVDGSLILLEFTENDTIYIGPKDQ